MGVISSDKFTIQLIWLAVAEMIWRSIGRRNTLPATLAIPYITSNLIPPTLRQIAYRWSTQGHLPSIAANSGARCTVDVCTHVKSLIAEPNGKSTSQFNILLHGKVHLMTTFFWSWTRASNYCTREVHHQSTTYAYSIFIDTWSQLQSRLPFGETHSSYRSSFEILAMPDETTTISDCTMLIIITMGVTQVRSKLIVNRQWATHCTSTHSSYL